MYIFFFERKVYESDYELWWPWIYKGVNEAIVIAYQQGILRLTTALVNSAYIQKAVIMMKENPGIGVRLQLNLI